MNSTTGTSRVTIAARGRGAFTTGRPPVAPVRRRMSVSRARRRLVRRGLMGGSSDALTLPKLRPGETKEPRS
jgi:hypothetical protein